MDGKFIIFEVAFISLIIYAFFNDKWRLKKNRNLKIKVKRGEASLKYFKIAFTIALPILLLIINYADIPYIYKTTIGIANIFLLIYLIFFNGWIRNKIVGWANKYRNMTEDH
jgi:hypothetical protein